MLAAGAMIGIFLFAGYLLQTVGLQTTTPPKSAFLTGLATVMVPLLGALVYSIKPQISEVAGVLAATLGMGLMTLEGPIGSIGRGDLLTFGGAVAFAAHIVATGHFAEQIGYRTVERYPGWRGCVVGPVPVLVGGDAPDPVAAAGGLGDTDNRAVVYRSGVHHPGVGAALHHLDAYRFDLRAGAGGRLDYVVLHRGRRPVGARRGGGGAHLERSAAGGDETVQSAATSMNQEKLQPGEDFAGRDTEE